MRCITISPPSVGRLCSTPFSGVESVSPFFALFVGICLFHENRWIQIQLAPEVDDGILYAEQALDAAAYWKRSSLTLFSLGPSNYFKRRRLLHLATKLAYAKHRVEKYGDRHGLAARIIALRREVKDRSLQDPQVLAGAIVSGRTLPPPLPPRRTIPPPLPRNR
mgnify:CR=1 FL=1